MKPEMISLETVLDEIAEDAKSKGYIDHGLFKEKVEQTEVFQNGQKYNAPDIFYNSYNNGLEARLDGLNIAWEKPSSVCFVLRDDQHLVYIGEYNDGITKRCQTYANKARRIVNLFWNGRKPLAFNPQ